DPRVEMDSESLHPVHGQLHGHRIRYADCRQRHPHGPGAGPDPARAGRFLMSGIGTARVRGSGFLLAALVASFWAGSATAAEIIVSAAASLTNAFTEVAREYERANPGQKVNLNFGGSGALLQQIARGAPVDVFASAD